MLPSKKIFGSVFQVVCLEPIFKGTNCFSFMAASNVNRDDPTENGSILRKQSYGIANRVFHMTPHSTVRLAFYLVKNMIFRKDLELPLIFVLFLKGKKIRKKKL